MYIAPGLRGIRQLLRVLQAGKYDALYLNSYFSPWFSLLPLIWRRLGIIPRKPTILAPKGEFSPGALGLKAVKKKAFRWGARWAGLHRDVLWQASTVHEKTDILRALSAMRIAEEQIHTAADIPADSIPVRSNRDCPKSPGKLRVVFVSRICPKKNLLEAIEILRHARGEITFDIYGPQEDLSYWRQCERAMQSLPSQVTARYRGTLHPDQVPEIFSQNHAFLFPTCGENFGYVIIESLAAGCPVLISDRTPWRNLESAGVGWDLPLERPERFQTALARLVAMDGETHRKMSGAASGFAARYIASGEDVEMNRQLFRGVCGSSATADHRAA
jgi:glycosyltransferase involved in cell wall biosynthesis